MKEYDLISIGTGTAMSIVYAIIQENPRTKIAVIDKDEPGGICLTRGCIPSKLLLYPAELVRTIENAPEFGIDTSVARIDFSMVMQRMRSIIDAEIEGIRKGLSGSKNLDYYPTTAKFVSPCTLQVGNDTITSPMIFLCAGSRPMVPEVKGLGEVGYHTSDSVLRMNRLPRSIVIVGGGYIAGEYGHFFSAMGSSVTVIGRNPRFLPEEEPEISALARKELQKHMTVITNHEVREVEKTSIGKRVIAVNRKTGETLPIVADEILIASGRAPNTDILQPEKGGIKVDSKGWILVDEYLQTSQPNVWAFGDANGKYMFKHKANYESMVVYYNAVLKRRVKVDYHAVPHAVFTHPEIAGVGLGEREAVEKSAEGEVLIGAKRYEDTAKGEAMALKDYFVKVIVEKRTMKILGAHIIGPHASVLIQEIVNLMYTPSGSTYPILDGMHIHPALSEVVEGAFRSLMSPEQYHHLVEHHYGLLLD